MGKNFPLLLMIKYNDSDVLMFRRHNSVWGQLTFLSRILCANLNMSRIDLNVILPRGKEETLWSPQVLLLCNVVFCSTDYILRSLNSGKNKSKLHHYWLMEGTPSGELVKCKLQAYVHFYFHHHVKNHIM